VDEFVSFDWIQADFFDDLFERLERLLGGGGGWGSSGGIRKI